MKIFYGARRLRMAGSFLMRRLSGYLEVPLKMMPYEETKKQYDMA